MNRVLFLTLLTGYLNLQATAIGNEPQLKIQQVAPGVSFRALKVNDQDVVVAGGTNSTVVSSNDGLQTWHVVQVTESAELDFRDVEAVGQQWILMSAGTGPLSRIFHSVDGAKSWQETHRNADPKGFYDGMAFDKNGRGLLIGDPIDGRLVLLETQDVGHSWTPLQGPKLVSSEYGFAASGSGIICNGGSRYLIATGGAKARILTSNDHGQTWQSTRTTIRQGNSSSGFFSIAENPTGAAVAVGGDYQDPQKATSNYAFRSGKKAAWTTGKSVLPHKACVRFLTESQVLCVGRTGIAISDDAGQTWKQISTESFYTFDVAPQTGTIYLAGTDGRMASLTLNHNNNRQ